MFTLKRKRSLSLLAIAFGLLSCEDGQPKKNCSTSQCTSEGLILICKDGQLAEKAEPCPEGEFCDKQACRVKDEPCVNGKGLCLSEREARPCIGAVLQKPITCAEKEFCREGGCIQESIEHCESDGLCLDDGSYRACVNGQLEPPKFCEKGKYCDKGRCLEQSHDMRPCGDKFCKGSELCIQGMCVLRNEPAEEGKPCDPKTFLESCGNNHLVYCDKESKKTRLSHCESLTCVLAAHENLGFCAETDPACKAPGPMTFCRYNDTEAYLDYFECTLAHDGRYYPFRKEIKTSDCEGGCRSNYACGLSEETCDPNTFEERCEDNIAVSCDEKTKRNYGMNCSDYEGAECKLNNGKVSCFE